LIPLESLFHNNYDGVKSFFVPCLVFTQLNFLLHRAQYADISATETGVIYGKCCASKFCIRF